MTANYYWSQEGWYVEIQDEGKYVVDSQKVWFPVDVDQFASDEEGEMVNALRRAYPGVEVLSSEAEKSR